MMLGRVFHFNLNVRDLDQSIAFYRRLGFELIGEATPESPSLGEPLGITATKLRAAFMKLAGADRGPMLDLVQFLDPPPVGQSYAKLNNVGLCRIAFRVADFTSACARLKEIGVPLEGSPVDLVGPGGERVRTACFRDPDGIVLQLFGKQA
jgi:catechol 2,3-dioxygenase-like lactoylglutathione lyase family enzyme